jgi:hypothetical protein
MGRPRKRGPNCGSPEGPKAKRQAVNIPGSLIYGHEEHDKVSHQDAKDFSIIVLKLTSLPTGTFPRCDNGTIYIEILPLHGKYTYLFHRNFLCRRSAWIKDTIDQPVTELDVNLAQEHTRRTGIKTRYALQFSHKDNDWALAKTVSHTSISIYIRCMPEKSYCTTK